MFHGGAASAAQHALQALGRLKVGAMSKTGAAYAATFRVRRCADNVAWLKLKAVKLRLASKTFCSQDFVIMLATGGLKMHEGKGFWHDDARVDIKVEADLHLFNFVTIKLQE